MEEILEATEIEKYAAYKDSGEDWIGEIPEHWEVKKLKLIFYEKKIKSNPGLSCGSISFGNVVTKDDEKIPLSTKASYQEVLKGDFLINPLNLNYDLISLRIALSYIDVVVSSGYIVIKEKVKIDKEYFKFLLHRYDVAYMKLLGSGVRQTINFNHIANSLLLFPPLKEQKAIASFLNCKTALIDQAISIKEKQIELLKERRQILIHQAVTRGLNPNVKMKDSGVEWIGEIPEHWEVSKLGFYSTSIKTGPFGSQLHSHEYIENGIAVINPSHIVEGEIIPDTSQTISLEKYQQLKHHTLKTGDLVFGRRGEMGRCAMVKHSKTTMICGTGSLKIELNKQKIFIEYLNFYLKMDILKNWFSLNSVGSTMENLNSQILGNVPILIPPKSEQNNISNYINSELKRIIELILVKEKEIKKLNEYKSSLINAAVTGKIKVRN